MPKLDLEKLRAKQAKVAEELEALKAQEEAELERQASIIGHAVSAEAKADPSFDETLKRVLDQRVKKKRDRVLVGLAPRGAQGQGSAPESDAG